MIDENLLNFVKLQVENGVSRDLVVDVLLQNGWRITDINNAYSEVNRMVAPKNVSSPLTPITPRSDEQFNQNGFTPKQPKQGSSIIMKIVVFIIILIFVGGSGLFVYLKFFNGNISKLLGGFMEQQVANEVLIPLESTSPVASIENSPKPPVANQSSNISSDPLLAYDKFIKSLKDGNVGEYNKYSYFGLSKEEEGQFKFASAMVYGMANINPKSLVIKWEDDKQAIYMTEIKKSDDLQFYRYEQSRVVLVKDSEQWKVLESIIARGWNVSKTITQTEADKMLQGMSLDTDQDGITDKDELCADTKSADPKCVKTDPKKRDTDGNGYWDGVDAIRNKQ